MFKKFITAIMATLLSYGGVKFYMINYHPLDSYLKAIAYKSEGNYQTLSTIDKVYILNLDSYPDRYTQTLKEFEKLKLNPSADRFSAINGSKVKFTDATSHRSFFLKDALPTLDKLRGKFFISCDSASKRNSSYMFLEENDPQKLYLGKITVTKRFPGEVGCYCSHREMWRDIVEKGYKKVLILEDDVELRPNAREILAMALENAPTDWDLFYLGLNHGFAQKSFDDSTASLSFKKVLGGISLTDAYIVSDKGARILLEKSDFYNLHVDHLMSSLIEKKHLTAYATYPLISRQVGESVISSGQL